MKKEDIVDLSEMDLVIENGDKINTIIELLIEKGIITRDEFEKKFDEISKFN